MLLRFGESYMVIRCLGGSDKGALHYRRPDTRAGALAFQVEYYLEETGRSGVLWEDLLWREDLPGLTGALEELLLGRRRDLFFQNRSNTFILWIEAGEENYTLRLRLGTRPGQIIWAHTADRDTLIALYGELEELAEMPEKIPGEANETGRISVL